MKYKELVKLWYDEHKKTIKESSASSYSVIIYNYLIPKFGNFKRNKIKHSDIQNYIFELSKKGLSNKTIKKIIIVLTSSLKYSLNGNDYRDINYSFSYPKSNNINNVEIFSTREKNKLANYLISNLDKKYCLGILIVLMSGIRIGELCALKWGDIDFSNGVLHINKTLQRVYEKSEDSGYSKINITIPKSQSSIRDIPISKYLLKILKDNKEKPGMYILTGNLHYMEPRLLRCHYDAILKKIKIRHKKFHSLRHTFASNAIQLGVDYKTVSEILGHSNVNTTLQLYVHSKMSQKRKCIELVTKKTIKN